MKWPKAGLRKWERGYKMDQEMTLDIREIYEMVKKRRMTIIVITLAATFMSTFLSFFVIKPTYEAKTTVIVGKMPASGDNRVQYNDVLMYQNLVKTYVEIAKSRLVAEKTAEKLGEDFKAEMISNAISVSPQANTQIMVLKATSKKPDDALNIVNNLSNIFIQEATRIYPSGNVQIIDNAVLPEFPVKPNKKLNMAIGFFLGLMASIGIVFLMEYLDNTLKTENDVEKYLELPVIGVIPKIIED